MKTSLTTIGLALALVFFPLSARAEQNDPVDSKLNIVLIQADDLAAGYTGFGGHPVVQTPNLDTLAEQSVQFSRFYTAAPIDGFGTALLLTGEYPHQYNAVEGDTLLSPHALTFVRQLKRGGYKCGFVGKWELSEHPAYAEVYGFEDYVAVDDSDWKWTDCPVWVQRKKQTADEFLTDWHVSRSLEFIEASEDKPFFLWLNLRAPHEPFVYPPGTEDLYPSEQVNLNQLEAIENLPTLLNQCMMRREYHKNKTRLGEARSKYYAMIHHMDESLGRLLDRLNREDMAQHTLVIFCSENGFLLGEHQLYGKGPILVEELIRSPLLIRHPDIEGGSTVNRLSSGIDLAPTLCEAAEVEIPVTMKGRSLLDVMRKGNPEDATGEAFVAWYADKDSPFPARAVLNKRFKFIEYLEQDNLLFDLVRDPGERMNVLDLPQYLAVVNVLQNRLSSWRVATNDKEDKPGQRITRRRPTQQRRSPTQRPQRRSIRRRHVPSQSNRRPTPPPPPRPPQRPKNTRR
jgi:arylsulfatase A-like enzyme